MSIRLLVGLIVFSLSGLAQTLQSGRTLTPSDFQYYGAVCDGSTDDTGALNSALAATYAAGGGTIYFPAATCKISGQITLPNDGGSPYPKQAAIRLTGQSSSCSAYPTGTTGQTGYGGTVLDFRYAGATGTGAKLNTYGYGTLEIDHILFKDGGTDTNIFFSTTNTNLQFHHNTVFGTKSVNGSTVLTSNDIFLFGSQTQTIGNSAIAAFQGYHTVIDSNCFGRVGHVAVFGGYANAVRITNNTLWGVDSGGNSVIKIDGTNLAEGNYLAGNLWEVPFYTHVYELVSTGKNVFEDGVFDGPTGTWFQSTASKNNTVIPQESPGPVKIVGAGGQDIVIVDGGGARCWGSGGCDCTNTNTDLGKLWFDTTTTTTAVKMCIYVSGTLQWVTK